MEVSEVPIIKIEYDTNFGRVNKGLFDSFSFITMAIMIYVIGSYQLAQGIQTWRFGYIISGLVVIFCGFILIRFAISTWPYYHCKLTMYTDFFEFYTTFPPHV